MSDQTPSAAPITGAETSGTPAAQTPTDSTSQPNLVFGAVRGSGLLRGKPSRTLQPTAPATAVPANYTPTTIAVITPEREYKNPFASETPAPAADAAPASPPPAPVAVAPAVKTPVPAPAVQSTAPDEPESEATLDILPPEPVKRTAVSWETSGFPQTSAPRPRQEPVERPAPPSLNTDPNRVIPEKNIYRPENKKPLEPREPREFRNRSRPEQSDRLPEPYDQPEKSVGFFGWLAGLFGKTKDAGKPAATDAGDRDRNGRQQQHHHGGPSSGGPREEGERQNSRRRGGRRHRRRYDGSGGENRSGGPSGG